MEPVSKPRSCAVCGASLEGADRRRLYCSHRCRQAAHRRRFRSGTPTLRLLASEPVSAAESADGPAIEAELIAAVLEAAHRPQASAGQD